MQPSDRKVFLTFDLWKTVRVYVKDTRNMYLVYFYGFFLAMNVDVSKTRQIKYNSEWIPLTEDEVYKSQIGSHGSQKLNKLYDQETTYLNMIDDDVAKVTTDSMHEKTMNLDIHEIRSKAIKLVEPDVNLHLRHENVFIPIEPETVKSVNELQGPNNEYDVEALNLQATGTLLHQRNSENVTNIEEVQNTRKPKAISEHSKINVESYAPVYDQYTELNRTEKADDLKKRSAKDKRHDEDVDHLYKVYEDPMEILDDETRDIIKAGYFYTPPSLNLNNLVQNNITRTFLNILSRHNIKPEDELPNYTLSRKIKAQNPPNAFMFIPVPLRVLPQFSNLKQLSVDPLLAVLMSNYGYYFPGSYGIHSRYKNLYGHLASNNIHNNKPFGPYKIFSDTDSSN